GHRRPGRCCRRAGGCWSCPWGRVSWLGSGRGVVILIGEDGRGEGSCGPAAGAVGGSAAAGGAGGAGPAPPGSEWGGGAAGGGGGQGGRPVRSSSTPTNTRSPDTPHRPPTTTSQGVRSTDRLHSWRPVDLVKGCALRFPQNQSLHGGESCPYLPPLPSISRWT